MFVPAGKATRPVYWYGAQEAKKAKPMYTCPVAAIPPGVWDLLALWDACRLTGSLPEAGGFLDQALSVQHAFPIFATVLRSIERDREVNAPGAAAALVLGALASPKPGRGSR